MTSFNQFLSIATIIVVVILIPIIIKAITFIVAQRHYQKQQKRNYISEKELQELQKLARITVWKCYYEPFWRRILEDIEQSENNNNISLSSE